MMSGERESFWKKLAKIDRRILYWILLILIIVPLLRPIGLPIAYSQSVLDAYDTIKNLKPGSRVLLSIETTVAAAPEVTPAMVAITKYLATLPVKIVVISLWPEGPGIFHAAAAPILAEKKKYGTEWVFIGFVAGHEVALSELGVDIHKLVTVDYYGTPIKDLPLMSEYRSAKDVDLVVEVNSMDGTGLWVRQWQSKYSTNIVTAEAGTSFPLYYGYYRAKLVKGMLGGLRGGAEFEKLTNNVGKAVASMDALSLAHLLTIGLVFINNIGYFMIRKEEANKKRRGT